MSSLSDSALLEKSCLAAAAFPKNIVCPSTPQGQLDVYYRRLDDDSERLFCEDGQAELDILEYDDDIKEFQHTRAESVFELKGRLEGSQLYSNDDPRCRFLFVTARHSRDRLRISRKMMVAALTHHQVIPSFLDFIFPFGVQEYPQDFHFSGLREDTRISLPPTGLVVPQLGRSGREIRLCYNLKSVERLETSTDSPGWPWSIRQTAVYHSFDVETGKSFWMTVKGSSLIQDRIQAATAKDAPGSPTPDLKAFGSIAKAFASTLATHLVPVHWCNEEWRWYLNYLEKCVQDATRDVLAKDIAKEPSIYDDPTEKNHVREPSSPGILRTVSNYAKKTFSIDTMKTKSWSAKSNAGLLEKIPYHAPFPLHESTEALPPPPVRPPPPKLPPGMPGGVPNERRYEEDNFTFRNLQDMQYLEEKADEISPILEANIDILMELKEHYQAILRSDECSSELRDGCQKEFAHFEKRTNSVITDLQRQRSRTQILRNLLGNRKALLYELSNKRSIEASRILSKKAQLSTERMERMTDSMYEIAKRTQQETVSMRIITLVTLFFLPGTFISWWYLQTIMSTDIIRFNDNSKNYQHGALQLYLAITIPFMALTFGAWYGMYLWAKRKDSMEADKLKHAQPKGSESSMV